MRSLFAKIFACMLLVPVLARGAGLLASMEVGALQPESGRMLAGVAPLYAATLGGALAQGGSGVAATSLRTIQARSDLRFRLLPARPDGACAAPDAAGSPRGAVYARVPGGSGGEACLAIAPPAPPRILGVIPIRWWVLLPLAEFVICGVVSFFLARYLAKPIAQIRAAASAFAAGDLSARAGRRLGRRRDEAGELVAEFDRMAEQVALSIEAQQHFIGDVSHEIKSPLARLSMALGLARRDAGGAASERFDRMERELETVSRLVRELLTLSTLQGSVSLGRSEPVDLASLLQEAIDDLTFEWHERAHAIRLIRRGGPVRVMGDAALLRRVAENVLANALFYTPDGTKVDAILDCAGPWVRLVVRDRGPGVPPDALPHLFRPFYRVDAARARNTGGVGLGLAICKRAVELHGGRIEAINVSPGLALRVELPALGAGAETSGAAQAAASTV